VFCPLDYYHVPLSGSPCSGLQRGEQPAHFSFGYFLHNKLLYKLYSNLNASLEEITVIPAIISLFLPDRHALCLINNSEGPGIKVRNSDQEGRCL
jgi:hypothetical protein